MDIKFIRAVSRIFLILLLGAFLFLLFSGCGGTKKKTEETLIEKTAEKSESSKVESRDKEKETTTTTTVTPEVIEKTETPINTDKECNPKDIDQYRKYGEVEVFYGIKNGNIYHNIKIPKTEVTSIATKESEVNNNEEKESYISRTDVLIMKVTKIVRGIPRWKLYLISALIALYYFRKAVVRILLMFFPGVGWLLWLSKFNGTSENSRIDKLEKRFNKYEQNGFEQSQKLDELKSMIVSLKPELFKA